MAKVKPLPVSGRTKAKYKLNTNCQRPPSGDLQSLLDRLTGCVELINEIRAIERRETILKVVDYIESIAERETACDVHQHFLQNSN